jgi:hypothetical protein
MAGEGVHFSLFKDAKVDNTARERIDAAARNLIRARVQLDEARLEMLDGAQERRRLHEPFGVAW